MILRSTALAAATAAVVAVPGIAQAYWGHTTTAVNMRACASTSCQAIAVVPYGQQVWVSGSTGSWYNVSYGGYSGFISASYVTTAYAAAPSRPQVTLGFSFGNRPPAPAGGFQRSPTWDAQHNAWFDGRRWYYNNRWYNAPPSGFSFGFNFGG